MSNAKVPRFASLETRSFVTGKVQLLLVLSFDNAILLCVTDTSHPPDTGKAGLGQSAMLVALQDGAQIMQDHIANQVSTTLDSGGAVRR